jgi:chromosome segregation ATPase
VDDSFKLLEERVHRAAERLAALAAVEQSLRSELAKEKERAGSAEARARDSEGRAKEAEALARKAEEALAAAESEGASGVGAKRAEELEDEVAVLRQEREEIRARVEKLVSLLERL